MYKFKEKWGGIWMKDIPITSGRVLGRRDYPPLPPLWWYRQLATIIVGLRCGTGTNLTASLKGHWVSVLERS